MKSDILRLESEKQEEVLKIKKEADGLNEQLVCCKQELEETEESFTVLKATMTMKDESHQTAIEHAVHAQQDLKRKLDEVITREKNTKIELERKLHAAVEEVAAKESLLASKDKMLRQLQQNLESTPVTMKLLEAELSDTKAKLAKAKLEVKFDREKASKVRVNTMF